MTKGIVMKATNNFIPCPVCGTKFDIGLTLAMPFCSERCQKVDLNRWMEEEYGVPWDAPLDEEEYEESSGHPDESSN
jgi:endogenous inhibitor of DNA gyrase (YacG/DUF329 family)